MAELQADFELLPRETLEANMELVPRDEIEATFEINIATKGDTGNGIESIEKTGTSGLVDTYTIQYTDGDSTTFNVTNGAKGDKGDTGPEGADAKINGVNTLTLTATNGVNLTQNGNTATISVTSPTLTNSSAQPTSLNIKGIEPEPGVNNPYSINIGLGSYANKSSVAIGYGSRAYGENSVSIGTTSAGRFGTAIGNSAFANYYYGTAIGYHAQTLGSYAIQIGYGQNQDDSTLSVGFYGENPVNYQLLDGTTGLIPDARISSNIARTSALTTETTNRQNADNNLQQQIDAITASSDVKDIVGTHAELEAYDTSTLGNNDIIKVLQDETQDNETTYYRWSTSTHTFTLIGAEGPYYTKSEANSTFVPQTRTVNGKALSENISLNASDVNALPDSTVIPTVNNATLTIQKNGTNVATFTANSSTDQTANITVPTQPSDIGAQPAGSYVTTNTQQTINSVKYFSRGAVFGTPNDVTYKGFFGEEQEFYIRAYDVAGGSTNGTSIWMYADDSEAEMDIDVDGGNLYLQNNSTTNGKVYYKTPTEDTTASTEIDTVGARNTKIQDYVKDATLTIQKNGTDVATFSANASTNATANITVPTNTNELTNGAGFITSSDIPVTDVTVNGTSVVSDGVAEIPKIPTSTDYWTVGTSGVSDYQTTYSKKTIFYTASGAQDNGFKMLASSDTAPSSTVGAWSGRCLIGNEKRTFLLGTARNSASGSQSICGLGAHTWGSASSQTSAGWDNVYIQPDGSTAVFLGGYGWRGSSGWFRVLNNNSGSAAYRTSINTGTNSSPAWKTVLPNNTTASNSILFTPTVSTTHSYTYSTSVNGTVTANYGTSYGYGSSAAGYATGLGYNAKATGSSSIQIGQGTNSTANTLSVGLSSSLNVQLLDSTGVIPAGRLNIASSVDSSSTNGQMVGAKLFYDTVGDIETLINNINSGS